MADLARYELWTFPSRAPPPEGKWVSPLVGEFGFDAKLRLLRGLRDGKPEQAAAEVRALAKLLIGSESYFALRQGVMLFQSERNAYDAYVAAGKTPLPEWQPWPVDRIDALRVLDYAMVGVLSPLAPDSLVAGTLVDLPAPLRCTAEGNAIESLSAVRDSGDSELAPALGRARGWLAAPADCRFIEAREHFTHGSLYNFESFGEHAAPVQFLLDFVPRPLLRPLRGTIWLLEQGPFTSGSAYRRARSLPK